jgi:drug/metabolite transporter (DMT)-like permease
MDDIVPGQAHGSRPNLARRLSVALIILGAISCVIGVVLILLPDNSASFGWFAYAPLNDTVFVPPSGILTPRSQLGILWALIGVALLAFGSGWAFGLRQPAPRRRVPDEGSGR